MSDEQMRIAIADACGIAVYEEPDGSGLWSCKGSYKTGISKEHAQRVSLPDYLNDLNACAEFEATLTDDELWEYSKLLMDYRQAANGFPLASRSEVLKLQKATVRQRCIAFLKTKGIIP